MVIIPEVIAGIDREVITDTAQEEIEVIDPEGTGTIDQDTADGATGTIIGPVTTEATAATGRAIIIRETILATTGRDIINRDTIHRATHIIRVTASAGTIYSMTTAV